MVTNEGFDQWERDWRTRLVGRSLVAEAEVDPDTAIRAFRILGRNWLNRAHAEERQRLARKYRAVLLAGLCAIGSRHYDAGTYWDHVWSTIGMPGDVNRQAELANAFRHGLTTLGLSRFTLTSRRNVGEILLHGGVPINSVGALAKTLARWDEMNPSGDATSFVAWLSGLSQKVAITRGIDVPTWLFLTETGEIAADFIDRCLIAIDHVAGATSEDPALPSAVLDEIALSLAHADMRRGRGARERRAIDVAPSLVFSAQRGVMVRLPPLEVQTESDIQWIVTVDGTSQRIDSPAPWPGDPVAPKFVPVRAPAKRAIVSVVPSEQDWELDLIDADDPLLVFDHSTQQLIPSRHSLPRGRVWVALPGDSVATAEELLECEGSFVALEKVNAPTGWDGWEFAGIDLSDATRVRLRGADRWRYVSTTRRPRIIDSTHVPFIETLDGRPVLAQKPLLELPGTGGEATMTWSVSVTTAEGTAISTDEYDVGAGSATVRLWGSTIERPLGDFIVNVRGPLGRGAALRVAIADGFSAVASTDFRWMRPDGGGLDSAELTIRTGAVADPDVVVSFASERWRRARTLRTGTNTLEISAKLPSMAVSAAGTAFRSRSGGPIPLDLESLVGTTLRVDVPPGTWGAQLAAVANGEFVQAINASQAGGAASFSLAQLSDTLETHRFAQLRLILGDRSVPVAYVRPGQLASAASVDGGVLALENATPVEGLMALAYPKYAPWRAPTPIQFPPGAVAVSLPEEFLKEGAATFVVSVANPWVPFEAPPLPDWSTRNAFVAEWSEVSEPEDPREKGFRSWLAGGSPCPSTPESLAIALKIYTLVPRIAKRIDIDRLRSELAAAVRSSREQVVEAVLRAESDANDLFRLFVEADVVTVPREAWESSDLLWSFSSALGIVADTDEHAGPHRDQLRDNLLKYVGESAIDILDAGTDPYATVGRFGPGVRVLDPMPQDRIDAMWAIANVLPRGLLDEDTRAQASKLLFDRRRDRSLDAVIAVSRTLITEARAAIATDLGPSATAPLDIRISEDGWMNLPALSLACAFVARTASRGGTACSRAFEKLRKAYMRLADAAPDIVQQDLGLAELWITRWSEQ